MAEAQLGRRRPGAGDQIAAVAEPIDDATVLVVAAAGFDTDALRVADAYGVDLVGPAALARLDDPTTDRELSETSRVLPEAGRELSEIGRELPEK